MHQISMEFDPTKATTDIASAIGLWVNRECVSLTERNNYLDKLEGGRRSISSSAQPSSDINAAKHSSHHNRQNLWGQALIEEPINDYATARHIFNALMQISGNSRMMRWLKAKDQAEYDALKVTDNVVGIEVEPVVESWIVNARRLAGDSASIVVPTAEESHKLSLAAFDDKEATINYISERAPHDFGQPHSPSLARLALTQELWIGVVTDSVLMAAGYRDGNLEAVPFLEPKSISDDPQVYYPFRH